MLGARDEGDCINFQIASRARKDQTDPLILIDVYIFT